MQIDDTAYTDIWTVFQSPWEHQCSIATAAPVVVFHVSSIHIPYTASRFNVVGGVNNSVIQCYHYRGWLEKRARFQQVAARMILDFSVFAVLALVEVHNSLDVSGSNLHDYGNADIAINLS